MCSMILSQATISSLFQCGGDVKKSNVLSHKDTCPVCSKHCCRCRLFLSLTAIGLHCRFCCCLCSSNVASFSVGALGKHRLKSLRDKEKEMHQQEAEQLFANVDPAARYAFLALVF